MLELEQRSLIHSIMHNLERSSSRPESENSRIYDLTPEVFELLKILGSVDPKLVEIAGVPVNGGVVSIRANGQTFRLDTDPKHFVVLN
jgi:hypothetical protein